MALDRPHNTSRTEHTVDMMIGICSSARIGDIIMNSRYWILPLYIIYGYPTKMAYVRGFLNYDLDVPSW